MAVAVATSANSNGINTVTTAVITMPSGIVSGDFLLMVGVQDFGPTSGWAAVTGWTIVRQLQNGNGNDDLIVYRRISNGTEGASVSVGLGGTTTWAATALRITGHDPTTPLNVSSGGSSNSGSTTAITCPTATTTATNCLIFRIGGTREASALSTPATYSVVSYSASGSTSTDRELGIFSVTQAAAAATSTAVTVATGASRDWVAFTVAVAPGAAPGGSPLFRGSNLVGIGGGGPFFQNPLAAHSRIR